MAFSFALIEADSIRLNQINKLCLRFTSKDIEVEGNQNSLFPAGPAIKCFVIPPNTKLEKTAKKSFALRRLSRRTT